MPRTQLFCKGNDRIASDSKFGGNKDGEKAMRGEERNPSVGHKKCRQTDELAGEVNVTDHCLEHSVRHKRLKIKNLKLLRSADVH